MARHIDFHEFKTALDVSRLATTLDIRLPRSLQNVADLLHERGIDIGRDPFRIRSHRFEPLFAAEIRRKRVDRKRSETHWRLRLDEVVVKVICEAR